MIVSFFYCRNNPNFITSKMYQVFYTSPYVFNLHILTLNIFQYIYYINILTTFKIKHPSTCLLCKHWQQSLEYYCLGSHATLWSWQLRIMHYWMINSKHKFASETVSGMNVWWPLLWNRLLKETRVVIGFGICNSSSDNWGGNVIWLTKSKWNFKELESTYSRPSIISYNLITEIILMPQFLVFIDILNPPC